MRLYTGKQDPEVSQVVSLDNKDNKDGKSSKHLFNWPFTVNEDIREDRIFFSVWLCDSVSYYFKELL